MNSWAFLPDQWHTKTIYSSGIELVRHYCRSGRTTRARQNLLFFRPVLRKIGKDNALQSWDFLNRSSRKKHWNQQQENLGGGFLPPIWKNYAPQIGSFPQFSVVKNKKNWSFTVSPLRNGDLPHLGVSKKIGVPQNGWFTTENPIFLMADLGVALLLETPESSGWKPSPGTIKLNRCLIVDDLQEHGETLRNAVMDIKVSVQCLAGFSPWKKGQWIHGGMGDI